MNRILESLMAEAVFRELEELRKFFALEMSLQGAMLPPTYDAADAAFLQWLIKQHTAYHQSVSTETKQAYLDMKHDTQFNKVTCERCGGDGWDAEGYLSFTGERMYCPRCGGSGEHLA